MKVPYVPKAANPQKVGLRVTLPGHQNELTSNNVCRTGSRPILTVRLLIFQNSEAAEFGQLQLVSFPVSKLDEAVSFIRQHCMIRRESTNVTTGICSTGLGGSQVAKNLEETLQVRQD